MSETATMTLTEFLLARFDEAEKMLSLGMDSAEYLGKRLVDGQAFVKADFEAKWRIVELHTRDHECVEHGLGGDINEAAWITVTEACETIRALALPYTDHPDFREEWRL